MYRTKLSLDFADLYLASGDTLKAIDRLFDYFLSNEAYEEEVTLKLRSILLQSNSQDQLIEAVDEGIHSMRMVKEEKTEPKRILLMTFLGKTIRKKADENLVYYQNYYRNHKNILALKNGYY